MEYQFKDLLPLDEVLEREGYYKDWTHLDPEVFYSLTQISEYIKTKGYGVDVRLLIAQLAEHFGLRVTQITDAMAEFKALKPRAELSISRSVEALAKSQNALNVANGIDAKATNALSLSESADTLSKSVQEQFNQVVIDGDSSVEAAQARVDASGHTNPTLKARLDKEHNEVTTQLAEVESVTLAGKNAKEPLPIPTYVFANQAVHPSVVYISSGLNGYKYWMAMTPYPASNDTYENPSIIASIDGERWEVPSGLTNPIDKPTAQEISDNKHMSDTHLIYVNGHLEVFYRLSTRDTAYDWIYRKTSIDGINWSERELIYESKTDGDYILSPALVYDGVYKMWFVDMSGNVWYTTSVDLQTWDERTEVNVDYHANYKAWHLDVQKIDNSYHLVINALRSGSSSIRDLIHVSSENETNFGKTKTLLTPSASGWDGGFLYRASLLKVDNHYNLYYSAFNNNVWGIGLLTGKRIDNMQDTLIARSIGKTTNTLTTNVLAAGNAERFMNIFNNLTQITTDKGTTPRVKMIETGVTGASLKLKSNGFSILADNDTNLGGLEMGGLVVSSISTSQNYLPFFKSINVITDNGTKPKIRLSESGFAAAELVLGTERNTMEIRADNPADFGNLEVGRLIVSDSNSNVKEGAIRYNSTTKKHQGYNGTSWNDMY